MITEKQYIKALRIIKAYQQQINEQVRSVTIQDLPESLEDMDLSVPVFNAIKQVLKGCGVSNEVPLKEQLSYVTHKNLKIARGVGPKITTQIVKHLSEYGIEVL